MKRFVFPLALLTACGGVAGSEDPSSSGTEVGTLGVALTTSGSSKGPVDDGDLSAIVVNIVEVRVHGADGWVVLNDEPQEVDILQLGEYAESLGIAELPDGEYKQLRLVVEEDSESFVVTPDGESHPLKTPSGEQSGLKIKGDFVVSECVDTEVTLALDAGKSIHVHRTGKGDQWILRPVIRATTIQVEREDCGEGEVDDPNDPNNGEEPNDPGQIGEPDPANGGEGGEGPGTLDPLDPNNPNGEDPNDPNNGEDPNDPNNGGDDPNDGEDPTDPTDPGFDTGV